MDTSNTRDQQLLNVLLDSWKRNNTILCNLVSTLPKGGLKARAMEGSPSVSEMLMHIHHERMVSVAEEAPEIAPDVPDREWVFEPDPKRIVQKLSESARVVRGAVRSRVEAGRDLDLNYDHPILLLQLLIFHEGYHHGQIKLALKIAGQPIADEVASPLTWGVWRAKSAGA